MSSKAPHSATQFLAGLQGQRVLVTAGASGIGFAIASTLSALGARLLICDLSVEAIYQAKRALPKLIACKADVADESDVDAMFDLAAKELGGLNALVNNAG